MIQKMRKHRSIFILAVLFAMFNSSQAAFADFSGDFAPDKWAYSETGPGPSGTLNATTMVLTSANNGGGTYPAGLTGSYTIHIPSGVSSISFTFDYVNNDVSTSYHDYSQYTLDGTSTDLSTKTIATGGTNSGTVTVDVSGFSGKAFSIDQNCDDCILGSGITTITGFSSYRGPAADVLLENSKPTLTAGPKSLMCTPGGFDMMRGGFFKQVGKPTSIVYTLIIAGKRVSSLSSDNWTGLSKVIYDSSDSSVTGKATLASAIWTIDSFAAGSAQCETMAYQESSVTSSNSNTL